ncbi:MAG: ribonuclease Z [Candidatus Aenigmarchaeota archaeon]|nr:ribonuclease Z [Candidatus Aenigmarchaeota archaeon]
MIEITFLGTVAGIPTKERSHPAIALEHYGKAKEILLFDCGEGTQLQLMKARISFMQIDKIFITHWHADHFAGLIPLITTLCLEKRAKELKIFAPEAEKFVSNILDLGYFGTRFPVTAINVPFHGTEVRLIEEGEEYQIFSIPVLHTIPSVAYCFKEKDSWGIDVNKLKELGLRRGYWLKKLKKFGKTEYRGKEIKIEQVANLKLGLKVVYTGDTKPCENVVKLSKGADLLIHDGTFLELDEADGKGHADVGQAAEIAKQAGVKSLILTNISRRYRNVKELENRAQNVFPNSKVAYDFMKVTLKK